jgi:hypothetical protein
MKYRLLKLNSTSGLLRRNSIAFWFKQTHYNEDLAAAYGSTLPLFFSNLCLIRQALEINAKDESTGRLLG